MTSKPKHEKERVAVQTTSGRWPNEGFTEVPVTQPVKVVLKNAAQNLKIASTEGWIAEVDGRELDVTASYEANDLPVEVVIDYGPREGGGGDA